MELYKKIILIIVIIGFSGTVYLLKENVISFETETIPELSKEHINYNNKTTDYKIKVLIKGAIKKPGLYYFNEPVKIKDIIYKAEGLLENAYYDKKIFDNILIEKSDTLIIGIKPEQHNNVVLSNINTVNLSKFIKPLNNKKNSSDNGLININTANIFQLMQLPGIGEKMAQLIIEHRKTNKFKNKEDLMKIPRIGPKRFAAIKNKITL
jgi:competence protein ComEA